MTEHNLHIMSSRADGAVLSENNQSEKIMMDIFKSRLRVFGPRGRGGATFALFSTMALAMPSTAQEAKTDAGFECLVQPKMGLKLGTPVPGLISELLVDRGAILKKGEVFARIESNGEAATVELARARAENESTRRSTTAKLEFQK